jgi:hypothetical protein
MGKIFALSVLGLALAFGAVTSIDVLTLSAGTEAAATSAPIVAVCVNSELLKAGDVAGISITDWVLFQRGQSFLDVECTSAARRHPSHFAHVTGAANIVRSWAYASFQFDIPPLRRVGETQALFALFVDRLE